MTDNPLEHVATLTLVIHVTPDGITERMAVVAENNQGSNLAVPVIQTMIEKLDEHRAKVGLHAHETERHEADDYRPATEDRESTLARRVGVLRRTGPNLGAEPRARPATGHDAQPFIHDA